MKNILITGGEGILGISLINTLLKKKFKIILLKKKNQSKKKIKILNSKKVKLVIGDLTDYKKVNSIIRSYKIDFIFHLGAITQVIDAYKSPYSSLETNIMGTVNILESIRCLKKKIPLIYSSSDKAYGNMEKKFYLEKDRLNGEFPYDVSKSASDLIAQSYSKTYGLKIGIIRSGNIYGPGDLNLDRLIPNLMVNCIKNKQINLRTNGKLRRDYIYVDDISSGYFKLMLFMKKNNKKKLFIYNLGSNENLNALELVNKVYKILNKKKLKPIIKKKFKNIEIMSQKLNYKKAKDDLKWIPKILFKEGIRKTFEWYKSNIRLLKTT